MLAQSYAVRYSEVVEIIIAQDIIIIMLKVYGSNRTVEREMLSILAEFRCRVFLNYPIKGVTRKVRGTHGNSWTIHPGAAGRRHSG